MTTNLEMPEQPTLASGIARLGHLILAPLVAFLALAALTLTYSPQAMTAIAAATGRELNSEGAGSSVINASPQAVDDTGVTPEDTALTMTVLANDTDPENDPLSVTAVATPTHGAATISGTTVVYTPATNFNGSDSFTYTAGDGGGFDSATITVTVTEANDAPIIGTSDLLYDGSLGTIPEVQGEFVFITTGPAESFAGGATTVDTSGLDVHQAGWFHAPPAHLSPILDRNAGYTLRFSAQVIAESHAGSDKNGDGVDDRAGFSLIILSSDLRGIEIGFWADRIWAQDDGPAAPPAGTLFTQAESAAFDTTTGLIPYELTILKDAYSLVVSSTEILSGSLRDYSAFSGFPDPYETPNFIFFGDDATSAGAEFALSYASLITNAAPADRRVAGDTALVIPDVGLMDLDAGGNEGVLTMTAGSGILTMTTGAPGGLTAGNIAGNGSGTIVMSGTIAELNTSLAFTPALIYRANPGFAGSDTMVMTLEDNGYTGTGGALADQKTLDIIVGAPEFDLQIRQTSNVTQVIGGQSISYTLTITNPDPGAVDAVVTDTFAPPAQVTNVVSAGSLAAGCGGTGPVICAFDNFSNTATITLTLTLSENYSGPLTNSATIGFNGGLATDPDPGNNTSVVTASVLKPPALRLIKGANPLTATAGGRITYTIVVSNEGSLAASGAIISDTLPKGVSFAGPVTVGPPGNTLFTPMSPILTGNLTLAAGEILTLTVPASLDHGLPPGLAITNTATITGSEVLQAAGDSATVIVQSPLLSVTKSSTNSNGDPLLTGDTITYTVLVSNSGNMRANNAVISDFLAAGTNLVANSVMVEPAQGQQANGGVDLPRLAWGLTITPGESITVTFAVTLSAGVRSGEVLTNTVSLTSAEIITPLTGLVADPVGPPRLVVNKTATDATAGPLIPGDTLTYTIIINNLNPAVPATGLLVSDNVPVSTTYVAGSIGGSGGAMPDDANPERLLWTITSLDSTTPVTLTYAVVISNNVISGAEIVNTASVTGAQVIAPATDTVTNTVVSGGGSALYLPLIFKN